MTKEKPIYFFSYARKDSDFVLKLAKELRAAGANVWIDQLDILAGQRWDKAVEDSLRSCKGMIVALSPESVGSNNVMDEVAYALGDNKLVVPILLSNCEIPFRLRRLHYVDFTTDYKTSFAGLLRALSIQETSAATSKTSTDVMQSKEIEVDAERSSLVVPSDVELSPSQESPARRRPALWIWGSIALVAVIAATMFSHQSQESSRLKGEVETLQHKVDISEVLRKADAGDADALNKLGGFYHYGLEGMPKDISKAVEFYRKSVEKIPHPIALLSLSSIYMHGKGEIQQDYVTAYMWAYLNGDKNYEKAQAYADIKYLEERMTKQQIEDAKLRAEEWRKQHYRF